jgi:hypothetical protein
VESWSKSGQLFVKFDYLHAWTHPASYPVGTGGSFLGGKAVGA